MAVKTRISALLSANLVTELKAWAQLKNTSLNALLEAAVQKWFEEKLVLEAEQLANINFDDLPSENDWLTIQSVWILRREIFFWPIWIR